MTPLRIEQMYPGMRVRCIHNGAHNRFGTIATITQILPDGHDRRICVKWDVGIGSDRWAYASSFEAFDPEEAIIPLTESELYVGLKVKCIHYEPSLYGKTGKISSVNFRRTGLRFTIAWDVPMDGWELWNSPGNFTRRFPKKFTRISQKKLRKLEREQMKAKAFLNR